MKRELADTMDYHLVFLFLCCFIEIKLTFLKINYKYKYSLLKLLTIDISIKSNKNTTNMCEIIYLYECK